MGEYQKYGNYRRENYGRKEWESIRSMGIIGGKTMAGKSGRVSEGWELQEGKLWPERVGEYQKDGNYRSENYGRKEWGSIRRMGIKGGKTMAGKNERVSEEWEF